MSALGEGCMADGVHKVVINGKLNGQQILPHRLFLTLPLLQLGRAMKARWTLPGKHLLRPQSHTPRLN
jgi:hypothetical protein